MTTRVRDTADDQSTDGLGEPQPNKRHKVSVYGMGGDCTSVELHANATLADLVARLKEDQVPVGTLFASGNDGNALTDTSLPVHDLPLKADGAGRSLFNLPNRLLHDIPVMEWIEAYDDNAPAEVVERIRAFGGDDYDMQTFLTVLNLSLHHNANFGCCIAECYSDFATNIPWDHDWYRMTLDVARACGFRADDFPPLRGVYSDNKINCFLLRLTQDLFPDIRERVCINRTCTYDGYLQATLLDADHVETMIRDVKGVTGLAYEMLGFVRKIGSLFGFEIISDNKEDPDLATAMPDVDTKWLRNAPLEVLCKDCHNSHSSECSKCPFTRSHCHQTVHVRVGDIAKAAQPVEDLIGDEWWHATRVGVPPDADHDHPMYSGEATHLHYDMDEKLAIKSTDRYGGNAYNCLQDLLKWCLNRLQKHVAAGQTCIPGATTEAIVAEYWQYYRDARATTLEKLRQELLSINPQYGIHAEGIMESFWQAWPVVQILQSDHNEVHLFDQLAESMCSSRPLSYTPYTNSRPDLIGHGTVLASVLELFIGHGTVLANVPKTLPHAVWYVLSANWAGM
jgi:hypothetical protein